MLKRRFILYIVGAGVVAFLSLSYVGYRAYQKQVEFEAFMSNAQAFNRSINGHYVHSSKDHTHGSGDSPAVLEASEHKHTHHPYPADGKYVYEVAGVPIYADSPMSQEDLEMEEWLITGKMTPAAEEYLKNRPKESRFDGHVIQRVVGPDGNLYKIIVPSQYQYEEGNAVLRSELDVPEKLKPSSSHITSTIGINGVEYNLPEEYYIIEDRYERAQYFMKFVQAKQLGISMAEANRMVAAGEMDLSLSEADKRAIDKEAEADERHEMLGTEIILPPLSDKPLVKVSLLPDEGEGALPGWMRKLPGNPRSGSREAEHSPQSGEHSAADTISSGGIDEDTSGDPVRADIPLSPSDLSGLVDSKNVPLDKVPGAPKTPQQPPGLSQEGQLSEEISPSRFDKAQQLIDQYGTMEGLRRLRKMDPEVARQFERERNAPRVPNDAPSTR
jgi:hypothetical protein